MSQRPDNSGPRQPWLGGLCSPFIGAVPEHVHDALVEVQYRRLHAILPVLCLIVAANTAAMTLAVLGEQPCWRHSRRRC